MTDTTAPYQQRRNAVPPKEPAGIGGSRHEGPTRYKHDENQKLLARHDDRRSDNYAPPSPRRK
jgi:hypothetical protein